MSADFEACLVTEESPEALLSRVVDYLELGPEVGPITVTRQPVFILAPGCMVAFRECSEETRQRRMVAAHIDPDVRVVFRVDAFDVELARETVIDTMVALLLASDEDATLYFRGGQRLLARFDGEVVLDDSTGFWIAENRALLPMPYRIEGAAEAAPTPAISSGGDSGAAAEGP